MKEIIEQLYPMNRTLLGEGFDSALEYINHLIPLERYEVKSGTQLGTWTVPDEWIVRDAWVKDPQGNKIVDYKLQPLSLVVGSEMIHGTVQLEELKKHLFYMEDTPDATPYMMNFYGSNWGFCVPYNQVREKTGEVDAQGLSLFKDKLPEGDYEVFIDTEFKPGKLKCGIHTVPGKSDREILLFAHLDHPYQANDNLSAVACLIDMVKKIDFQHTIKLIFCAETIGSIAYAYGNDLSKVDAVIAVDICGNENSVLLQKSFTYDRINQAAHLAIHSFSETYRKGAFRNTIGSDEYVFNDPLIGIPGLLFSTWPYKEYHTSEDTPDKINYETIEKVQKMVLKTIEIYEKDFIPKKEFKGPLMRSRYGIQSPNPQFNLSWDYMMYSIDGKRSLAELCADFGLPFDQTHAVVTSMENDGFISRVNPGKVKVKKTAPKKHKKLSRGPDVPSERQ